MESEKILPFNLVLQKKFHLRVFPSNKFEQMSGILGVPEPIYVTSLYPYILLMEAKNIFQCAAGV